MRTLKIKAQPTNAFFATVNQMFGGSSQLPTTAELCFVSRDFLISNMARKYGSSQKLEGAAEHSVGGSEKLICRLSFEF